jgi:hypothetical protein
MNYIISGMDNQLKTDDLVPELPPIDKIPNKLKDHESWVCWKYHKMLTGITIHAYASEPDNLSSTLAKCKKEEYGLGFMLTGNEPFAVLRIDGNHHKLKEILELACTYTAIDKNLNQYYAIAQVNGIHSAGHDGVQIYTDRFIMPVTGYVSGPFPDVDKRTRQFYTIATRYCSHSWMDKVTVLSQESPGSSDSDEAFVLLKVLNDCLDTPDWRENAIATDLFPFMKKCFKYPTLEEMVQRRLREERSSFKEIDAFYKAVHAATPKKEKKKPTEDDGILSDDSIVISHTKNEDEDNRPKIFMEPDTPHISLQEGFDAILDKDANLYQRDGELVFIKEASRKDIRKGGITTHLKISEVKTPYLRHLASKCAIWYKPAGTDKRSGKEKWAATSCPEDIAKSMLEQAVYPFPILDGVVTCPTIRSDGSVLNTPGYDLSTGLYYLPSRDYPEIPKSPTRDDARESYQQLENVFINFPLSEDWHKSTCIAAICTVVARHLVRTAPMFPITSNTPGSGKSLLATAISMIATGATPAFDSNAPEEEMAKKILTIGMEATPIVVLDNVRTVLGCPSLDRALTGEILSGRILGLSKSAVIRNRTTFFATGNNLRYGNDLIRRIVPITLSPKEQNPEERTEFEHKDLLGWIDTNQPKLLVHALTILKAYIEAGKPDTNLPPYGGFSDWSDIIRSAIVWCGAQDPNIGRDELVGTDEDVEDLMELVVAWHKCYPHREHMTLGNIIDFIQIEIDKKFNPKEHFENGKPPIVDNNLIRLGNALLRFAPGAKRLSDIRVASLTRKLPVNSGASRVVDGYRLHSEFDKHIKTKVFWVEYKDPDADANAPVNPPMNEFSQFDSHNSPINENEDLPF